MYRRIVPVISLCMACSGDRGGTTTGDTGVLPPQCGEAVTPVAITRAVVGCDGTASASNEVTFRAEATGWTGDGYVFAIETAASDPWSEEHDLPSIEFDPCGTWDHVEQIVGTRAYGTTGDIQYERNVTSFFTCAEHYSTNRMTYAIAVKDVAGTVVDCWALGADPEGLIAGNYADKYINLPTFDIGTCVPGTLGR